MTSTAEPLDVEPNPVTSVITMFQATKMRQLFATLWEDAKTICETHGLGLNTTKINI